MKRQLTYLILCFSLVGFMAGGSLAGGLPQDQVTAAPMEQGHQQGQEIIVKGKVAFAKGLGGYYLNGEDPNGEFMIVNQNPTLLEELLKSGKMIAIDGRLRAADFLFIEKIDGRPYQGKP